MGDSLPLISCVMPTAGRQQWAAMAVQCYKNQTYPNKELVVIDDNSDPSFTLMDVDRIDCTYGQTSGSIPVKRNMVNAMSMIGGQRAGLIAHFDSDDWSDPNRLADQYRFMKETGKSVVGFHSIFMVDPAEGLAFRFNGPRPLDRYCLGTSLLYTKAFWQKHPFDERKAIASDVAFVDAAYAAKELATVDGGSLMVARIHEGNTSKKRRDNCTNYQPIHWSELPEGFRNLA